MALSEDTGERGAQGDETWWEESAPVAPARADYGTAPLGDVPEAQPASDGEAPDDLEATRPLGVAPLPAEEQIELESDAAPRQHDSPLAAALRDVGKLRHINQDHVFSLVTSLPREESDLALGLFIVADGMGGHEGGEIASRLAISTVARYVLAELIVPALDEQFGAALQPLVVTAVKEANRAIWDHARAMGSDMGTTCTVALVLGRTIYIGHVGDSRAYLAGPDGMRQLTTDHSAVGRLIQLGQLDAEEAREHPMRSQLYRTIGQQPDVHVDFIQRPIGAATRMLLCSDGLWSMVDDDVIQEALLGSSRPQDACRALVTLANDAGGEDNIGVVVAFL